MSEQVKFGQFMPQEKSEDYLFHMHQVDILLFEKSNHLVNEAMQWLQNVAMEAEYVVGADRNPDGCLILEPKSQRQPDREFSKDLGESKLAKMKSKLGPK